jgi:hypothetical protein
LQEPQGVKSSNSLATNNNNNNNNNSELRGKSKGKTRRKEEQEWGGEKSSMESSCITRLSRSSNFHKIKRPESKKFYSDLLMNSLPPSQQIIGNFEFEKIFAICDCRFIVYCCFLFIFQLHVPLSVMVTVVTELRDRKDITLLLEGKK